MKPGKIIIAPDSFKGALTAKQATDIIAGEISAVYPDCAIVKMPIADGGEGSVATIIGTIGGQIFEAQVQSPDDRLITANYGITVDGTAILEMAQSSGITKQTTLHPMTSSTYGFGQLILAAIDNGATDFVLCIGGSATTDAGCGMAAALGVRFTGESGSSFVPCGATLHKIARIDISGIDKRIPRCRFTVMCDVDNPLYGENGAACVYGPQKGADPSQVTALDEGLRHIAKLLDKLYSRECKENSDDGSRTSPTTHTEDALATGHSALQISAIPGAGAAGGLGAGCIAFLNAKLMRGIDAILKLCGYNDHITGSEVIITGEGRLDSQSFSGKVLSGVLREARNIPVWSICGVCECDETQLNAHGIKVFQTSEGITKEESMRHPEKYLRIATIKAIEEIKRLP